MTLADFVGKYGVLDVPMLMELDDENFASVLFDESKSYMENHGRLPCCRRCDMPVSAPENLVRYFGTNLHDNCFVELYERERNTSHFTDRERTYFDRVLKMVKARNKKEFDFTI